MILFLYYIYIQNWKAKPINNPDNFIITYFYTFWRQFN